jgi:hypothetical protein
MGDHLEGLQLISRIMDIKNNSCSLANDTDGLDIAKFESQLMLGFRDK